MRDLTPILLVVMSLGAAVPAQAAMNAAVRHHVTVMVRSSSGKTRVASGIIVNGAGLVATAAHVARSTTDTASVVAFDGSRYAARVLRVMPKTDLAFLQVLRPWGFKIAPLPLDAAPEAGNRVVAVGIHADRKVLVRTGSVSRPRYCKRFRFGSFGFRNPVVLHMRVESGFSGGPVLDAGNRWVGMVLGYRLVRRSDGEDVNSGTTYVLPAARILENLGGQVSHPNINQIRSGCTRPESERSPGSGGRDVTMRDLTPPLSSYSYLLRPNY